MTLPTSNISIQDLYNEATGGGSTYQIGTLIKTTGTFTVPTGVTSVKMTAVGGGGGGGLASYDGDSHAGGGGGAGGVHSNITVAVTPGEVLQVEVGAGGNNGSALGFPGTFSTCGGNGTVNGSNGGNTRVYRASAPGVNLVFASGGYGGNGGVGDNNAATDANHTNGGSGNAGTPGTNNTPYPRQTRNAYFYTEGGSNNTGFGYGGDGQGLATGTRCPTPGGNGAVFITYTTTGSGGVGGYDLNDYYAGGGIVPFPAPTSVYQTSPIPTSGTIELGSFLGVTFGGLIDQVDASLAASLSGTGYDVATRATALGWNGTDALNMTITVLEGATITNTAGGYAFTCSGLPAGSTIELINNGYIVGRGGAGGAGGAAGGTYASPSAGAGSAGAVGGPAMLIGYPITITNNGLIGGGGGGGGGGGAAVATFDDTVGGGGGGGA